jgi:fucose permease
VQTHPRSGAAAFRFHAFFESGMEITMGGWSSTFFKEELKLEAGQAVFYLSFYWLAMMLARLLLSEVNLLLLDEPANHLEIEAVEALALTLEQFPGAIVFARPAGGLFEREPPGVCHARRKKVGRGSKAL